jgi:hypothetical protein
MYRWRIESNLCESDQFGNGPLSLNYAVGKQTAYFAPPWKGDWGEAAPAQFALAQVIFNADLSTLAYKALDF